MKTLMLVNPHAGGRGNINIVEKARSRFVQEGWDLTILRTQNIDDAVMAIKKAVDEGFDLLVLVGGDGTLHHAIQHLPQTAENSPSPLPFGIIPLGSGNDLFRGLGSPRDPVGAAENIIHGKPVPIDIGTVTPIHEDGSPREEKPIYFINTVGVGMDSQTLATREKSPKWLSARYELVFLMTLARLVPVSANLVADDWSLDIDANWILVCNNRYIGSGMHVAPDALIDDGLMDILLIPKKSKLEFIYHLPKIFQGRQLEVKGVQIRKAKSLTLKCRPEQRVACDGDLTFPSPAKISIRKNALALRTSWINGRMVQ